MSAQPSLPPKRKCHEMRLSMALDAGLAERLQIYNLLFNIQQNMKKISTNTKREVRKDTFLTSPEIL